MSGWLKLHRKMREWEWYRDIPVKTLFMHCLLRANFEPSRFQGVEIPAGSLVCGIHALAEQTGLTPSQVRTAINKLKRKEIAIKNTNKFSIISIINWGDYQTDDKPIANKSQTDDKPIATSKELKNLRTKEKEERVTALGLQEIWSDFEEHRKKLKKPMTLRAENEVLDKAERFREQGFSPHALIATAIERGWLTVFKPREENEKFSGNINGHGRTGVSKSKDEQLDDALAEVLGEIRSDSPHGPAMLRHPEHLRENAGAIEKPDESDDRRPKQLQH